MLPQVFKVGQVLLTAPKANEGTSRPQGDPVSTRSSSKVWFLSGEACGVYQAPRPHKDLLSYYTKHFGCTNGLLLMTGLGCSDLQRI
jgi:hypothetical protein